MTDSNIVHIGENSTEHVAYNLMKDVMFAEGKSLHEGADRKYLLDTYAECLMAAKGYRDISRKN